MSFTPNHPVARDHASALLRMSRRTMIKAGGLSLFGMHTSKLWAAAEHQVAKLPVKAKSVIFLFQWGGPSHLDMFDMKPDAPDGIRGPYKPMKTSAPDIQINERMPKMAKLMDRCTLIRSVNHTMKNHNSAGYYALSGWAPPSDDQRLRDSLALMPAYGSLVDRFTKRDAEMPSFVSFPHRIADGSTTPGQHASFLGKAHDPLFVPRDPNAPDFALPELSLPEGLSVDRLQARRGLQKIIDDQARLMEWSAEAQGLDAYYDKALAMLKSDRVRAAFDLSKEKPEVRDAYGRHTYGQSCLLARRLVEAGVKFVNVYFDRSIGGQSKTSGGWDTHGFNNTRMFPIIEARHLPITEQTLPTLLLDLEERGLLDETLVLWVGEFGRTPKINGNISRDHWPQCYTALLAGGGTKGGYVHGSSDAHGMYPSSDPVTPDDLAATVYHLMGVNPENEIRDNQNRPLPITRGKAVLDIIA